MNLFDQWDSIYHLSMATVLVIEPILGFKMMGILNFAYEMINLNVVEEYNSW